MVSQADENKESLDLQRIDGIAEKLRDANQMSDLSDGDREYLADFLWSEQASSAGDIAIARISTTTGNNLANRDLSKLADYLVKIRDFVAEKEDEDSSSMVVGPDVEEPEAVQPEEVAEESEPEVEPHPESVDGSDVEQDPDEPIDFTDIPNDESYLDPIQDVGGARNLVSEAVAQVVSLEQKYKKIARRLAEEKYEEELGKMSEGTRWGPKKWKVLPKIWKGKYWKSYGYSLSRQGWVDKYEEEFLAQVKADPAQFGADKLESDAVVNRFELGEVTEKEFVCEVNEGATLMELNDLAIDYLELGDERRFREGAQELISQIRREHLRDSDDEAMATNLTEKLKDLRVRHARGIDRIDIENFRLTLKFGRALNVDVHSEVRDKSWADKAGSWLTNKLQRLGKNNAIARYFVSPPSVGILAYGATNFVYNLAFGKSARLLAAIVMAPAVPGGVLAVGAGVLAGGGLSALHMDKHVKRQDAMVSRREALGVGALSGEKKSVKSLIASLDINDISSEAEVLTRIAEIEVRNEMSMKKGVDLISFSDNKSVEQERTELLKAITKVKKLLLENRGSDYVGKEDRFKEDLRKAKNVARKEINKMLKVKGSDLNMTRLREAGKAFLYGAGFGGGFSLAGFLGSSVLGIDGGLSLNKAGLHEVQAMAAAEGLDPSKIIYGYDGVMEKSTVAYLQGEGFAIEAHGVPPLPDMPYSGESVAVPVQIQGGGQVTLEVPPGMADQVPDVMPKGFLGKHFVEYGDIWRAKAAVAGGGGGGVTYSMVKDGHACVLPPVVLGVPRILRKGVAGEVAASSSADGAVLVNSDGEPLFTEDNGGRIEFDKIPNKFDFDAVRGGFGREVAAEVFVEDEEETSAVLVDGSRRSSSLGGGAGGSAVAGLVPGSEGDWLEEEETVDTLDDDDDSYDEEYDGLSGDGINNAGKDVLGQPKFRGIIDKTDYYLGNTYGGWEDHYDQEQRHVVDALHKFNDVMDLPEDARRYILEAGVTIDVFEKGISFAGIDTTEKLLVVVHYILHDPSIASQVFQLELDGIVVNPPNRDLEHLQVCFNLERIFLKGAEIPDYSFLKEFPKLSTLVTNYGEIFDDQNGVLKFLRGLHENEIASEERIDDKIVASTDRLVRGENDEENAFEGEEGNDEEYAFEGEEEAYGKTWGPQKPKEDFEIFGVKTGEEKKGIKARLVAFAGKFNPFKKKEKAKIAASADEGGAFDLEELAFFKEVELPKLPKEAAEALNKDFIEKAVKYNLIWNDVLSNMDSEDPQSVLRATLLFADIRKSLNEALAKVDMEKWWAFVNENNEGGFVVYGDLKVYEGGSVEFGERVEVSAGNNGIMFNVGTDDECEAFDLDEYGFFEGHKWVRHNSSKYNKVIEVGFVSGENFGMRAPGLIFYGKYDPETGRLGDGYKVQVLADEGFKDFLREGMNEISQVAELQVAKLGLEEIKEEIAQIDVDDQMIEERKRHYKPGDVSLVWNVPDYILDDWHTASGLAKEHFATTFSYYVDNAPVRDNSVVEKWGQMVEVYEKRKSVYLEALHAREKELVTDWDEVSQAAPNLQPDPLSGFLDRIVDSEGNFFPSISRIYTPVGALPPAKKEEEAERVLAKVAEESVLSSAAEVLSDADEILGVGFEQGIKQIKKDLLDNIENADLSNPESVFKAFLLQRAIFEGWDSFDKNKLNELLKDEKQSWPIVTANGVKIEKRLPVFGGLRITLPTGENFRIASIYDGPYGLVNPTFKEGPYEFNVKGFATEDKSLFLLSDYRRADMCLPRGLVAVVETDGESEKVENVRKVRVTDQVEEGFKAQLESNLRGVDDEIESILRTPQSYNEKELKALELKKEELEKAMNECNDDPERISSLYELPLDHLRNLVGGVLKKENPNFPVYFEFLQAQHQKILDAVNAKIGELSGGLGPDVEPSVGDAIPGPKSDEASEKAEQEVALREIAGEVSDGAEVVEDEDQPPVHLSAEDKVEEDLRERFFTAGDSMNTEPPQPEQVPIGGVPARSSGVVRRVLKKLLSSRQVDIAEASLYRDEGAPIAEEAAVTQAVEIPPKIDVPTPSELPPPPEGSESSPRSEVIDRVVERNQSSQAEKEKLPELTGEAAEVFNENFVRDLMKFNAEAKKAALAMDPEDPNSVYHTAVVQTQGFQGLLEQAGLDEEKLGEFLSKTQNYTVEDRDGVRIEKGYEFAADVDFADGSGVEFYMLSDKWCPQACFVSVGDLRYEVCSATFNQIIDSRTVGHAFVSGRSFKMRSPEGRVFVGRYDPTKGLTASDSLQVPLDDSKNEEFEEFLSKGTSGIDEWARTNVDNLTDSLNEIEFLISKHDHFLKGEELYFVDDFIYDDWHDAGQLVRGHYANNPEARKTNGFREFIQVLNKRNRACLDAIKPDEEPSDEELEEAESWMEGDELSDSDLQALLEEVSEEIQLDEEPSDEEVRVAMEDVGEEISLNEEPSVELEPVATDTLETRDEDVEEEHFEMPSAEEVKGAYLEMYSRLDEEREFIKKVRVPSDNVVAKNYANKVNKYNELLRADRKLSISKDLIPRVYTRKLNKIFKELESSGEANNYSAKGRAFLEVLADHYGSLIKGNDVPERYPEEEEFEADILKVSIENLKTLSEEQKQEYEKKMSESDAFGKWFDVSLALTNLQLFLTGQKGDRLTEELVNKDSIIGDQSVLILKQLQRMGKDKLSDPEAKDLARALMENHRVAANVLDTKTYHGKKKKPRKKKK
ncbi:MAG: hypothetical protein ABII07_01245 [Patescibacteria group bacterium]